MPFDQTSPLTPRGQISARELDRLARQAAPRMDAPAAGGYYQSELGTVYDPPQAEELPPFRGAQLISGGLGFPDPTIPGTGLWTNVPFYPASGSFNEGGFIHADGYFVIPEGESGYYVLGLEVRWLFGNPTGFRAVAIHSSGSDFAYSAIPDVTSTGLTQSCSCVRLMSSGGIAQVRASQDSGAPATFLGLVAATVAYSRFWLYKIGTPS